MTQRLRVLVSSPGDVRAAREIAALTIERIAQDYSRWFDVQPYLWESEPVVASRHFQDSLELPSNFDVVVMVLWSRLGTYLPEKTEVREYRGIDGRAPVTGTEWEFEEALQASQRLGTPELLVYRCLRAAAFDLSDADRREQQLTQLRSLENFWQRHFSRERALGHTLFMSDAEFATALEIGLRKLIERRIALRTETQDRDGSIGWNLPPFRGLESYEFEHAPIYFGQDESLTKAMVQLTAEGEDRLPFLIVLGASGSGKSSLVKAGIVPKLFVQRRVAGAAFLRRILMRPSDTLENEDIIDAFARRMVTRASDTEGLPELLGPGQSVAALAAHFRNATSEPGYPIGTVLGQLTIAARTSGRLLEFETAKVVVVIDQLEELYTSDRFSSEQRRRFVDLLIGLLKSGFVWVICTMRKDFWHRADETPALVRISEGPGRLELLPPTPIQLSQMIRRPAESAGLRFEIHPSSGIPLNEVIAEEVAREPAAMPLLSYLMDQLYRRDVLEKGGSVLTDASYESLGRLEGAIATQAEAVLERCVPEVRQALGPVLFSLVQLGKAEGEVDRAVARRVPLATFEEGTARRRLVDAFLHSDARLLVTDAEEGSVPTVRVAHEALISRWTLAREFVETHAAALKIRRRIEERYALWRDLNGRPDRPVEGGLLNSLSKTWRGRFGAEPGLLVDIDVVDGERLLRDHRADTDAELVAYIERSMAQERRRRTRSVRVLAGVAVVVAGLAVVAFNSSLVASKKRKEAEFQTSQTLAAQERLLVEVAANRLKEGNVASAQSIIMDVLTRGRTQGRSNIALDLFQKARASDSTLALLIGHRDYLETAVYSPDGKNILTSSRDKTVRIWDAGTGRFERELSGHKDMVLTASYSPDGTHILTASADKTARIWDVASGSPVLELTGHTNWVRCAAYSPDGKKIVTASYDHSARIWDAATGALIQVLNGHTDIAEWAAFSPDGSRVVTASLDKTAKIWDVRSGKVLLTITGHGERVATAVYSPDGAKIVTSSFDRTARIWNAETGAPLAVLSGHTERLESAHYSPDGKRIVTAAADNTTRIWDSRSGAMLGVLSGHAALVISAAYSPDGTRIVSASYDGTARIWDAVKSAPLLTLVGHEGAVGSAEYSPDGLRIVTGARDNTARVWDAKSGQMLATLAGHTDMLNSAKFSPDGKTIVTASFDRSARIWNAESFHLRSTLIGHDDVLHGAQYSPDSNYLVTNSMDKTARLWDAKTGAMLRTLPEPGSNMNLAVFSPDGEHIATASNARQVHIWDAHTGTRQIVLAGHEADINVVVYANDGKTILTGSDDKTVRVWDARTGSQLKLLPSFGNVLNSAMYSADGMRLLTLSDDGTVRILDAKEGVPLAQLPAAFATVSSAAYSPDGTMIVTSLDNKTASIWQTPATAQIDEQIVWMQAAQFDSLTESERMELGTLRDPRVRTWSEKASACDLAASSYYDPNRRAAGVPLEAIVPQTADAACTSEFNTSNSPRASYQEGRVMLAKGDIGNAVRWFERAEHQGYSVAKIDLAGLLLDASGVKQDVGRAITLYEEAWRDHVPIAGTRLAALYEHGAPGLSADSAKAQHWLKLGADSLEPEALGHIAEQTEIAAAPTGGGPSNEHLLLQALALYTLASEQARLQAWPDAVYKVWRYRRATLARVLAHDGLIREVVETYRSNIKAGGKGKTTD